MRLTETLNTPKALVATLVLVLLSVASFSIGIRLTEAVVTDTSAVAPILEDSQRRLSLDRVAIRVLGPLPFTERAALPPLPLAEKA